MQYPFSKLSSNESQPFKVYEHVRFKLHSHQGFLCLESFYPLIYQIFHQAFSLALRNPIFFFSSFIIATNKVSKALERQAHQQPITYNKMPINQASLSTSLSSSEVPTQEDAPPLLMLTAILWNQSSSEPAFSSRSTPSSKTQARLLDLDPGSKPKEVIKSFLAYGMGNSLCLNRKIVDGITGTLPSYCGSMDLLLFEHSA